MSLGECKAAYRRWNKISDDLLDKCRKMDMQKMNLQHGLFANFSGKHSVVSVGLSNEKCVWIFLEKIFSQNVVEHKINFFKEKNYSDFF